MWNRPWSHPAPNSGLLIPPSTDNTARFYLKQHLLSPEIVDHLPHRSYHIQRLCRHKGPLHHIFPSQETCPHQPGTYICQSFGVTKENSVPYSHSHQEVFRRGWGGMPPPPPSPRVRICPYGPL